MIPKTSRNVLFVCVSAFWILVLCLQAVIKILKTSHLHDTVLSVIKNIHSELFHTVQSKAG